MSPTPAPKKKRTGLYIALGCLGLIGLCCLTGVVGACVTSSMITGAAKTHAESFLTAMQANNFDAAYPLLVWDPTDPTYSKTQYQTCLQATALADMTSFQCEDPSMEYSGHINVSCTLVSQSKGSVDTTLMVNDPGETPYMGFIYFESRAAFTPVWGTRDCAGLSGSRGRMEPPTGRIRP